MGGRVGLKRQIERYQLKMGLAQTGGAKREDSGRWLALERAHDIRKFEIELYWKRATYFFLLQAAVLTGIGFALPGRVAAGEPAFVLALGSVGYLTALAGYHSAIGSRFWQRNWERHIDYLEGEFEGALYKAVWTDPGDRSWSVTRINQSLTAAFVALWIGVVLAAIGWIVVDGRDAEFCLHNADPLVTFRFLALLICVPTTAWFHLQQRQALSEIEGVEFQIENEARRLTVRGPN